MSNFSFHHQVKFTVVIPNTETTEVLFELSRILEANIEYGDYDVDVIDNYSNTKDMFRYRVWSSDLGQLKRAVQEIFNCVESNELIKFEGCE